jgi:hypothetical protein
MNQKESKVREKEELVRSYLNDTLSKTYSGISKLGEEATETVLKESCKACTNGWLGMLAHYGYDSKKPDIDAFLVAEKKVMERIAEGKASIIKEGNIITEVLTPGHCGCPLVKNYKLVKPFPGLCLCAKNGYKRLYETALQRPAKVEVIETYNRGGNSCTMKIELF